MKSLKYFLAVSLVAFLACRGAETAKEKSAAPNEIAIGQYGSMTGAQASYGQSIDKAVRLAVDEVNKAGGVNGRHVHVYTEDDQSKNEEVPTVVSRLISEKNVVAIVGEAASSASLAGAPVCQAASVPMITPISTNPEVTRKGDYIFRACFIDPYQGEALARYLVNDLKLKRAAVLIDVKSDYSNGLAAFFEKTYVPLGGVIVSKRSYAGGDADFHGALTSIKAAKPDAIFVPGYYSDVAQIAIQARELGITQPLVGGDGWDSPKLLEIAGHALDGSFFSNHYYPDDPSPVIRDFVTKYKARYGEVPDAFAALGYDASRLLLAAIGRAPSLDRKAIRDELARTMNFPGVTGAITFDENRNPRQKRLVVLGISGGKVLFKGAVDPAKKS